MKKEIIEQKLCFLYEKIEYLDDASFTDKQITFLMEEIDFYRAELLKIQVNEYYEVIENEND